VAQGFFFVLRQQVEERDQVFVHTHISLKECSTDGVEDSKSGGAPLCRTPPEKLTGASAARLDPRPGGGIRRRRERVLDGPELRRIRRATGVDRRREDPQGADEKDEDGDQVGHDPSFLERIAVGRNCPTTPVTKPFPLPGNRPIY
jgi:hypothetical protein